MLEVWRHGHWQAVRTFDNAHAPTEHHEHLYLGTEKQPPTTTVRTPNEGMAAAIAKIKAEWPIIIDEWEKTRGNTR